MCSTINDAKDKVGKKDKALVVIITDGAENSSREYTQKDLSKLVEGLQAKGNWTFTYLGANQDAWANASKWGFDKGNVASFNATDSGATMAFASMSTNSAMYVRSSSLNSKSFYADDAKKLKETM